VRKYLIFILAIIFCSSIAKSDSLMALWYERALIVNDGTWIGTSGNWSDTTKWTNGVVASGVDKIATLGNYITSSCTVTLDVSRTVGNIYALDTTHNYTIGDSNTITTITMDRTSGTPVISVVANRTLTINSIVAGNDGFSKQGVGILALTATNTYSGDTTLLAGMLNTYQGFHFGSSTNLLVTGTAIWRAGEGVSATYNIGINIAETANLQLQSGNAVKIITGVLSGSGSMTNVTTTGFTFSNTNNTFTGILYNGYQMTLSSLGDSTNAVNLNGSNSQFIWAGTNMTFALRKFTLNQPLAASNSGKIHSNGTGPIFISQPLSITGTAGARTLELGGSNTSSNTFAGAISNGVGSVVSLTKSGNGYWYLRGTNTYSGNTTFIQGLGRVIFQGTQSISPSTTFDLRQMSTPSFQFYILDDGVGTINFGNNIEFVTVNSIMKGTIVIGNNNISNGGFSEGTTTGSKMVFGNVTFSPQNAIPSGPASISSPDGYSIQFSNLIFGATPAVSIWSPSLGNGNADITITGTIQQNSGQSVGNRRIIYILSGTSTNNLISGNILNASDYPANTNTAPLGITKQGSGTWTLSGTNTFSGTNTISVGKLIMQGASAVSTSSPISIATAARIELNYSGGVTIPSLISNNVAMASGAYSITNMSQILGTGYLIVP